MLHLSFEQLQALITQNQRKAEEVELSRQLFHTTYTSQIETDICQGSATSTQIREGINLLIVQLTFRQDTRTEIKALMPQIGFGFCLKGQSIVFRQNIQYKPDSIVNLEFTAGMGYIYASDTSVGWQQFEANKTFKAIYLIFSYDAFKQLLGEQITELPLAFTSIFESNNGFYLRVLKQSSEVAALCKALTNNPFNGQSKQFYREAKVIELIAYQINELTKSSENASAGGLRLTYREESSLEFCYEVLLASLDNPPSLIELAREVGMSDYRLKQGFRQKYGITPSRLVAEKRMDKARELLQTGKLNVSEVAAAVGFNSLGSFSNSFYEKFGIRPSEVK